MSPEALRLVEAALALIEAQVRITPGFVHVEGVGPEGPLMDAAWILELAHRSQPLDPLLHYAYASSLDLALQRSTAAEALKACAEAHPGFALARLALQGRERRPSMFTLPPWRPGRTEVPAGLLEAVQTSALVSVRDGLHPRAALFIRDTAARLRDLPSLPDCRISVSAAISTVTSPPLVSVSAKVGAAGKSVDAEVLETPFRPAGHPVRRRYEYLCLQEDIDVVVLDDVGCVLLDRRVPMSGRMMETNRRLLRALDAWTGMEVTVSEVVAAASARSRPGTSARRRHREASCRGVPRG